MAIISSYPVSTPQFADQVLGSNTYDSTGTAVTGNPTVQYTLTSIKTLVDQNFIEKINSSNSVAITPPYDTTGAVILFGGADITTADVTYTAATGVVTFISIGTYYIQQLYYGAATAASSPLLAFKTMQAGDTVDPALGTQLGPTNIVRWKQQTTSDKFPISITTMVNITTGGSYCSFWAISDLQGAAGTLQPQLINASWGTNAPSAQLIISKLI
tara:strand:+ start:419 stop:1063 length:645 start_codon:yes stop_codon:yes gene_type:complete